MTERRRRPHAAAGARILSAAVSASLMIATVGNLVAAEHRKAPDLVALAVAPQAAPQAVAPPTTSSPAPLATAPAASAPPVTPAPATVAPPAAPRLVAPARTHARSHAS
jgi:hypothetical protein